MPTRGNPPSPLHLAYEAIHIERSVLAECVGLQDQATAAIGGFNVLEFRAEDDIRVTPLALPPGRIAEIENHLFLVFTGIKRKAQDLEAQKLLRMPANLGHLRKMRRMVDSGYEVLTSAGSLAQFRPAAESGVGVQALPRRWRQYPPDRPSLCARNRRRAWGGKLSGPEGAFSCSSLFPPTSAPP